MTDPNLNTSPGKSFKKPLNVLVVDDDAINLYLIKTLLVRLGHHVDTVKDGAAAVDKFISKFYDVILMDVMMPVMDGVTATIEIRKLEAELKIERSNQVKIIAITANSFEDDRAGFFRAGMDYYMSKPFQIEELQRLLNV